MAIQPFPVPRTFAEKLTEYDPLLRVRWDHRDAYWRVERKVGRRWAPYPHEASSSAEWECYRDGHVIVLRVPPQSLDNRVLWALWEGDIQRRGGARKVAESMEAYEHFKADSRHQKAMDEIGQRTKSRWDSWNTNYPKTKW